MLVFKIWIMASILLTAYGGLSDADDDMCAEGRDVCNSEETRRLEFPKDIEALDKMCPAVTKRLSCLLEYQNKCDIVRPGSIDEALSKLFEITLDACDKNSDLHQDFADNLPCLKTLENNHHTICFPIVRDAVEAVSTRISLKTDDEGDYDMEEHRKLFCLYEAFDFACLVARAGVNCGPETKEFVGRLIDRVGILDAACQVDIRDEVKEMVEIIQLEMEQRMAIGEIFS